MNSIQKKCIESRVFKTFYLIIWSCLLAISFGHIAFCIKYDHIFQDEIYWWLECWSGFFSSLLMIGIIHVVIIISIVSWFRRCNRNSSSAISLLLIPILLSMTIIVIISLNSNIFGPGTRFATAIELSRLLMKVLSTIISCSRNVPKQDVDILIRSFIYFLFAPTFLYQTTFHLNGQINLMNVVYYLQQFVICIHIFFLWFRYIASNIFQYFCIESISNWNMFIFSVSIIPFLFLVNLTVLHVYCNLTAEITRFPTRQFHSDYWNSYTVREFSRKWNLLITDCIEHCLYQPLNRRFNRTVSLFICFTISGIFHEFISSMVLKRLMLWHWIFYYPVTNTLAILYIDNHMSRRFPIVSVLAFIFFIFTAVSVTVEYYSEKNDVSDQTVFQYLGFTPRFTSCLK